MRFRNVAVLLGLAGMMFGGCASSSSSKEKSSERMLLRSGQAEIDAEEEAYGNPGKIRLVCRKEKPTGSRIRRKVCYAYNHWQNRRNEAIRELERILQANQAGAPHR